MDLLYNLLRNSTNIVSVETTTEPKELLARKAATVIIYYDERGKFLRSINVDYESNTFKIDDTVYVYEPLPDEAILSKDAQIILMGILSDVVFSGQFNPEIVDEEAQHFYNANKVYFESIFDCKLYMYLQLKPCIEIFNQRIDDIIGYSRLLLVERELVFGEDFLEEEELDIVDDTDSDKIDFACDIFGHNDVETELILDDQLNDESTLMIVPDNWKKNSNQHQKNMNKNEG